MPFRLREQVIDYVASVADAIPEIFSDAGIEFSAELRDDLLFLAGIRKIWTLVNGQFELVNGALTLLAESDVRRMRIGSMPLDRQSDLYRSLKTLRDGLQRTFIELGIFDTVRAESLTAMLLKIATAE